MNKKKLVKEQFNDFFYIGSKWIIFVPIIIIVLTLVFKLGQTFMTVGTYINQTAPEKTIVRPTPNQKSSAVDLKGPYVCDYNSDKIKIKAYVKNGKAAAVITANNATENKYYFDGDCVYVNQTKGTCGLKAYVGVFSGVIGSNTTMIDSLSTQYLHQKVDVSAILNSCRKEDFKNSLLK